MAPSPLAAAALIALPRPLYEDRVVNRHVMTDVAQLTSDVLAACRRQELDTSTLRGVQAVVLNLLHCRQPVDFQLQLLQLLCAIKRQIHWSMHEASDIISVLATLVLSVETAAIPTIESTASLIIEIAEEQPRVDDAIQDVLAQWTRARPSTYMFLSAKRLSKWGLQKNFDAEAKMLRDGSRYAKEAVLKCLLLSERSVRERFIEGHQGAELLQHVLKNGCALVKALALVFAKDTAIHSSVFRAQMHDLWWQKHQQEWLLAAGDDPELLALACDPELLAVVSDHEVLSNDALVRGLQHGEIYEQVIHLNTLKKDEPLARRLCVDRNLLEVLSSVLSCRSKMDTVTTSTADMKITSEFWTLLLQLVNSDEPLVPTENVLIGAQCVVKLALDVLTTNERAPSWTLNAQHTLSSSLLRTQAVRHVVVDSGAISSLVTLLAEQQEDTTLGRDLIVLLRSFTASDVEFADEIDQVVMILCSYNGSGCESEHPSYCFQNLLLLYRELPAVRLGRATAVRKAINAVTVAELLATQGGDAEKLLMASFLHSELQLRGLDPERCALDRFDENAVVNAVAENLDAFVSIALHGPVGGRELARQVLTVVARSDPASRERLREYALVPSSCGAVAAELLENELRADRRTLRDERVVSENSDGDGEEKADEVEIDISNAQELDKGEDFAVASHSVDPVQQEATEIQDALAGLSMGDDDWELI